MFKRIITLLLLVLSSLPILAQDNTPPTVRETALNAGELARGIRATNWNFQVLTATTDSALACPLVQGETLPYEVTPYRVELLYDDGIYVVHVSADGRYAQLCDSKFGDLVISPVVAIELACTATPAANLPAYVAPNITVEGVFAVSAGTPYRVFGATSDGGWIQVASENLIGWVEAGSVVLSPPCSDNVVVTAFTAPESTSTCYASPVSVFSNVRSRPSTDAEIVGQIFENSTYQATARNTNADWLYVQPGWVSLSVLQTAGDCLGIPVNDALIGVGFVSADSPNNLDANAGVLMARFACPADFAGYIQPNLTLGSQTAQVIDGTLPLAVRVIPSINDTISERLGTIAPNTVLDRVIAGPACNEGYVWWLVQEGTLSGWTAEGSGLTNERYIVPSDAFTISNTPNTATEFRQNTEPIGELFFTSDGSRLFSQGTEAGFGDTQRAFVEVWDIANATSSGRITVEVGIMDLDYAIQVDVLAIGGENGAVALYQGLEGDLPALGIVTLASNPDAYVLALSPLGERVYVAGCIEDICNLSVYQVGDGEQVWSTTINSAPSAIVVHPEHTQIAVASDNTVTFYDVDGAVLETWSRDSEFPITAIAYNNDGTQMLAGGCAVFVETECTAGRIGLLNTETFEFLGTTDSIPVLANNLRYAPDGETFVTMDDTTISERNAGTGAETQTLGIESAVLTTLTYVPDSNRLAVGTEDGRIFFVELGQ